MQAGAGIVADSEPDKRVRETRDKAAALLRAVELAHEQFGEERAPDLDPRRASRSSRRLGSS